MKPPGGASSKKTLTNWLDLPRDLTIQIFIKVGLVDLLCSAQSVCSSWRAIARDPRLYCVIDIRNGAWKHFNCDDKYDLFVKLGTEAIDRSCGQAIEFSIAHPDYEMKNDILYQLKYKTPGLKCLRLSSSACVNEDCMIEVIPQLPLLEDVEFCNCYFTKEVIQVLGRSCPKLKSFRWNNDYDIFSLWDGELFTEVALAIAGNMNPTLRSLDLYGHLMNNTGLEAILDRFSQLEYLDIRECFNLDLNGDLLKRCQAIKRFRPPNYSTKDVDSDDSDGDSDKDEDDDSEYSGGDSDKDVDDDSDYNGGDSDKDDYSGGDSDKDVDDDSDYSDGDSEE